MTSHLFMFVFMFKHFIRFFCTRSTTKTQERGSSPLPAELAEKLLMFIGRSPYDWLTVIGQPPLLCFYLSSQSQAIIRWLFNYFLFIFTESSEKGSASGLWGDIYWILKFGNQLALLTAPLKRCCTTERIGYDIPQFKHSHKSLCSG